MDDWRGWAACEGTPLDLWFRKDGAQKESLAEVNRVKQAKAYCEECPVRRECLNFAVTNAIPYGIWGGRTEDELASLRRKRSRHRLAKLVS